MAIVDNSAYNAWVNAFDKLQAVRARYEGAKKHGQLSISWSSK